MQGGSNDDVGITDINVTPLVDISLVLVIIFMVTAPMVVQSGIIVNSSSMTASVGKSSKDESVQVKITKNAILLNNKKIDTEQFPAAVKALLDANKVLLPKNHSHSHEGSNIIIPPVNIHPEAKVENCIIGPHVSIGPYSNLKAATLTDCIVDARAIVEDLSLKEMIVGEGMVVKGISPVTRA